MKTKTMKTKTMKTMKILAYMFIAGLFTACSSGDDNDTPTPIVPTSYSGEITEDVTWTSDNIYTLDGRVVTNGATLTIEAEQLLRVQKYWSRCIMFNNCERSKNYGKWYCV